MATKNTTRAAKTSVAAPKKVAAQAARKTRKPSVTLDQDGPVKVDGYVVDITARLEQDRDQEPPKRKPERKVKIREGLKEELLQLLKDKLQIKISSGGFTDPNGRTIEVLFDKVKLTEASFDVVQTREYEG